MSKTQLKNLAHRHQAIAEWMIANPGARLGECAQAFGMTRAWLSTVIHSDLFLDYLGELQGEYQDTRIFPLRDKLHGVAHRAVEKLGTAVDNSSDAKFLLEAADKTLHRLGYAPTRGPEVAAGGVTQQTVMIVDGELLASARESMLVRTKTIEGGSVVELGNDTAEGVPSDSPTGGSEPASGEAILHKEG